MLNKECFKKIHVLKNGEKDVSEDGKILLKRSLYGM